MRSFRRLSFQIVCLMLTLTATTVRAAPPEGKKPPDPDKVFARKDADKDGFLTLDEFKTGMKEQAVEKAPKRFQKLDANSDGKLSPDEFKAMFRDRAAP